MTVWARSNLLFITGLLCIVAALVLSAPGLQTRANAVLGGRSFVMLVADTPSERSQGLSGNTGLEPHEGMLFVFEQPERSCFWMKDMRFSLDILWFDGEGKLIGEKYQAEPGSYPESFCASEPAKYVVEVNAGTAQALGLKRGDRLKLL